MRGMRERTMGGVGCGGGEAFLFKFFFSLLCFVVRALRACFSRVTGFSQLSFYSVAMCPKIAFTKIVRNLYPLYVTFNFRANLMKN